MHSGTFFTSYAADAGLRRMPLQRVRIALLVVLLLVFPFVASPYWLTLANQIGITTIGAIGLMILTGYTGQISLGHGAFLAVGAYGTGLFVTRFGLSFWLAIPLACLATAAVGIVFGLPSLRLKGLYLAIATLAAQEIVEWIITHTPALTGGTEALVIPAPTFLGEPLNTDFVFYWIVAVLAGLTALFAVNLFRSRVGRAFIAIRDQDIAAEVIGVDVYRYKLLAFAISSFFAGLAGGMIAFYNNIISWERFTLATSVFYLAVIIIGGLGRVSGAFFGAVFMTVLPALINDLGFALQGSLPAVAAVLPAVQQGVFGAVIILFLIIEPEGLAKLWRNVKDYFYVWPFSY